MDVYIGLLIFVFVCALCADIVCRDQSKKNAFITYASFLTIYILLICKDYTVGTDIDGYKDIYEQAAAYPWFDSSWTYMEYGYCFLIKLFNSLGFSFRGFLYFVYALILFPVAYFIRKESRDVTLSIIIYICFQFFVFNISALRQSMAMSLCLIAYSYAQTNGFKSFLKFIILIIIAASVHKSAYIFLFAYYILRKPLNGRLILYYLILIGFAVLWRNSLLTYLQDEEITSYDFQESLTIGYTFLMLLIVIFITIIMAKSTYASQCNSSIIKSVFGRPQRISIPLSTYASMLIACEILMLSFNGTIIMRASSYYELCLLVLLPNLFQRTNVTIRPFLRIATMACFIALFYYSVLIPSQFNITPYQLGSDIFQILK